MDIYRKLLEESLKSQSLRRSEQSESQRIEEDKKEKKRIERMSIEEQIHLIRQQEEIERKELERLKLEKELLLEREKLDLAKKKFEVMNLVWYKTDDEKRLEKEKKELERLEIQKLEKLRLDWLEREKRMYESLSKISSISNISSGGNKSSIGLKTLLFSVGSGTISSFMNDYGLGVDVASWNLLFDLPTYGSEVIEVEEVSSGVYNLRFSGQISIKQNLFQSDFHSINIQDSEGVISSVGDYAFVNSNVVAFNSISCSQVGESGFENCINLVNFNFNPITDLGVLAFSGDNLGGITMDLPLLVNIGESCFDGSILPVNVMIGDNCQILPNYCFSDSNLQFIQANGVLSVGVNCFKGCTLLSSLTFDSLIDILTGGFMGCIGLVNVVLDSVVQVSSNGFNGCSGLQTISLKGCLTIGDSAFRNCNQITEIYLDVCTSMGSTLNNDSVFTVTGNNIQMGLPVGTRSDLDIVWLEANNSVTYI